MELTKYTGWGTTKRYRLTSVDRGGDHQGQVSVDRGDDHQSQVSVDRPVDRPVDRGDGHDLLPPTPLRGGEEEEESTPAFAPDGASGALPSLNGPNVTVPDLFAEHDLLAVPPEPGADRATSDLDVMSIVIQIANLAGPSLDAERIGRALERAAVVTGWPDDMLVVYCVEKLRRNDGKVRDPSGFLAADLARVGPAIVPSPR